MQNEPWSNRVEAASAGQWTVLFFSVTKKIKKKKKKSYNPPSDHIKKIKKQPRKITIFFPFPASLPSLPSLDCDFCH